MKFLTDKITWTASMKAIAREQVNAKLVRLLDALDKTEFKLSKTGPDTIKVAVSVDDFRAQAVNDDFYIALSEAVTKLKTLLVKSAKKQTRTNKQKTTEILLDEADTIISKDKTLMLSEISIYQAIENFDKTDYAFYVFKDIDAQGVISILYKKFDNTYGVIRCK